MIDTHSIRIGCFYFFLFFWGDKIQKDIAKIMLDDFCQKRGINLDEQVKKEDE